MKRGGSTGIQSLRRRMHGTYSFISNGLLFIALALNVLHIQNALGRQIEFANEEIELTIADSSCTVQAWYWFKNKDPNSAEIVLFYPFVVNEQLPYPDTIDVTEGGINRRVRFTKTKDGIYFSISVRAFAAALYKVLYVQRTAAKTMEYLLRTTAEWKKPLEHGLYRVRVPEEYVLTSTTLLFSQIHEKRGEWIYEACEEQFMPSKDFIIQWQRKEP